ncbi:hypothetical protein B0H66DRAFT_207049 [Apodospora peruviana]|uniref:SnoaL-like domain-containing protein n=1 Tax=Apodospora peruviana TaxID=516989 RepID=A0AAE0ICM9_9PEZI|nr:hypothetical protein B0H66DRAFT_207049 [Apodospora peruviana]
MSSPDSVEDLDWEYEPYYPTNVEVPQIVKDFIKIFFKTSDTPGATDEWTAHFHDDAVLVMGKSKAYRKDEIRKLRVGMWDKVEARKHRVRKLFASNFTEEEESKTTLECMMFGDVQYRLKMGERVQVDWAAHAKLEKRESSCSELPPWGFKYYRVFLQT